MSAKDLYNNLDSLDNNITTVLTVTDNLDQKLIAVDNGLALSGEVKDDLTRVEEEMLLIIHLMKVLSIVPQIRDRVKTVKDGITLAEKPIGKAKTFAEDFDNALKPARNTVEYFEKEIQSVESSLKEMKVHIETFANEVKRTEQCVISLPEGPSKIVIQQSFAAFVERCNQAVVETNQSKQEAEKLLLNFKTPDSLIELLQELKKLYEPINTFVSTVDQFFSGLKALSKAMSEKITYDLKILGKTYPIRISIEDIVKKIDELEDYIEQVIGDTLWSLLEKLGLKDEVSKARDWFIEQKDQIIKSILKTFKLDFIFNFPGLEVPASLRKMIKDQADAFKAAIETIIGGFKEKIEALNQKIEAMEKVLNQNQDVFENCFNNYKISFGDYVGLKSVNWSNFLSARGRGDKEPVGLMSSYSSWERWTIIDPNNPGRKGPIRFQESFAFKSLEWGNYLSARGGGNHESVQMMAGSDSWEKWTLINPDNPSSKEMIGIHDKVALRSSKWGNYLSGRAGGDHQEVEVMSAIGAWEQWLFEFHF